ncbi:tRNA lysidine(34) synthetase TilS, partial [bacterium]|nr:tRNA lysidine(34) synthetase TilS [bacterium]
MNKKGDFLSSVASSCQQSFFDDCSKIIVGLSGGPDSVFLFLLLLRLKKTYGFSLHALHINHQLRGEESQSDEQFVRNLCRTYNVPLHISPAAVADHAKAQNISIEMAARELRYNAFLHYAEELSATHISTGHTADDKIETALMRLITGCGIEGLTGLRSSRLYKGRIFIRPLLSYWKSDIVHWLDMNSVPYRIDASNKSDAYFRNKIRNKLIPFIVKEFNPNFKATLSHSLELLEKTASALEDTVPQKSNFYIYKSDSLYIFSKKVLLSYPDG